MIRQGKVQSGIDLAFDLWGEVVHQSTAKIVVTFSKTFGIFGKEKTSSTLLFIYLAHSHSLHVQLSDKKISVFKAYKNGPRKLKFDQNDPGMCTKKLPCTQN